MRHFDIKRYPRERGKNIIHYFGEAIIRGGATIQGNTVLVFLITMNPLFLVLKFTTTSLSGDITACHHYATFFASFLSNSVFFKIQDISWTVTISTLNLCQLDLVLQNFDSGFYMYFMR